LCISFGSIGGGASQVWLELFVTKTWDPVAGDFGALPFIYGTLVTSVVGLALRFRWRRRGNFLAELAPPKLSSSLTFVSDLLAAVPSVIYGLLGVFCWFRSCGRPSNQP